MKNEPPAQVLIVEGSNDQHVIWALCKIHNLPNTFIVETANEENKQSSVEQVIKSIPIQLRRPALQTLGIIVDADLDVSNRWQQVQNKLNKSGFQNLSDAFPSTGLIINQTDLPRVGVWIMPDNQTHGKLEDFVRFLIDPDDELQHDVEGFLAHVEAQNHHKYRDVDHIKAFVHTWLACQKVPGQPMGQAITAKALRSDSPIAQEFVQWLQKLFIE